MRLGTAFGFVLLVAFPATGTGCKNPAQAEGAAASASAKPASLVPNPVSSLLVEHGELDTKAPSDAPKLAATVIAATVYKLPDIESRRLGYIRLGGIVQRDSTAVSGKGCKGEWYRVYPMGFVCTDEATTKTEDPLVRAASMRADLSKPLPYKYGFVRATAPQYLRIPSKDDQQKSEMSLDEHLAWYVDHKDEVQKVLIGANDIALDARGIAQPGLKSPDGFKPSTDMSLLELFGGKADGAIPFWLEGGKRAIPNVSGFNVPDYAVFADRVRRKTGLSFVGAFDTDDNGFRRPFGITVDLRLIPITKVKPDTGSPFHGVELGPNIPMPFAFVVKNETTTWKLIKNKDESKAAEEVPKRAIVPLSGNARIKDKKRFYQTLKDKTRWLRAEDIAVVTQPTEWPEWAEKGEKWIDISLNQQTLVLYEGKRAWYATLVSTGRDRIGDPKTTLSTQQGKFRLQSKHIAAAMDSNENTSVSGGTRANTAKTSSSNAKETTERLKQAQADGEKLSEDDRRRLLNIEKGRDPEYGITVRRGAANFELRDVPWIQYFAAGYALHGAYWHDVFGIPRSHGCVNLSPIDARLVFRWTDPPVPEGWHGINIGADMGQGTAIWVRE